MLIKRGDIFYADLDGWGGCEASWTGRQESRVFRPSELSRSRCMTDSCCTSAFDG